MRRPLCALLVSFALVTSLSEAQQSKSKSPESGVPSAGGADSTTISLLQQSHEQNQQLPVRMRLSLLREQAQMVSHLRADLGREWANELFTLSSQTEGNERSFAQDVAMSILARLDPNRALELLHSMSMEEPEKKRTTSLPKMQLVQQVFQVLVARDGVSALPVLEQEAERLAIQGHYPYAALGYAAMQVVSREWGSDKQHAVEVVRSVFERAFTRYSQNARGYFDDFEFGTMLQAVAGGLPRESVQPALRLLVKNLLGTDTNKYQFRAEVYTTDGKSATVNNAIDAAILNFGGLINRLDSELAQQLESTRPELQLALEYAKDGRQSSGMFGSRPQTTRPLDPDAKTRMDAGRLSHTNPEAAIAKAQQLPDDDKRAGTMLEVARGIAGGHPERAAELIAETQRGDKAPNEEMQLNLISARVCVVAAQDKEDELHELLQRGFESANRIILEQQKAGGVHFVAGLAELVQIGIQNDPDLTISFVQSLSPSYLKAQLLLEAASALNMRTRLPLGSRPQQRAEKPYQ